MGRRSRQRTTTPLAPRRRELPRVTAEEPRPRARPGAPRRPRREAPTAPWGSFPVVELCALAAIVLGVCGVLTGGRGGAVMLTVAALLGSVAGLEIAIREHLGGFRSHTLVLSGTLAVATLALLFFAHVDRTTMLPVAVVVFAAATLALRALFKRRSGGFGFRVR